MQNTGFSMSSVVFYLIALQNEENGIPRSDGDWEEMDNADY